MTSPRRAERRSISSLISFSVRMSIKTSRGARIFLRIPELVEAFLVDSEVVRELVQDGAPDLLLELGRVRERLRERLAEDRDLVRHVLGRLPEAEQLGVVRVLVLNDHGDVFHGLRKLRGQFIQRLPHVLLEPHRRRGPSGGRTWNALIASAPNRKPPTCAANATPPPCPGCVIEKFDCQS